MSLMRIAMPALTTALFAALPATAHSADGFDTMAASIEAGDFGEITSVLVAR